jgi:hypothetical protein
VLGSSSAAHLSKVYTRRWSWLVLFGSLLGEVNCSLGLDASELNSGCGEEQKDCGGRCVSLRDPEFGCGSSSCQPCVLPNATSVCDAQLSCTIAACVGHFEDCDGEAETGCEVNLDTDEEHCGSCTAEPCQVFGALPACARGACAIRKCLAGFKDCNRLDADGCETPSSELVLPDAGAADASVPAAGSCPAPPSGVRSVLTQCEDGGCGPAPDAQP